VPFEIDERVVEEGGHPLLHPQHAAAYLRTLDGVVWHSANEAEDCPLILKRKWDGQNQKAATHDHIPPVLVANEL
jgi:hypothetical protein